MIGFINKLALGKRCYMKKDKSRQRYCFWWEDYKDQWFMNVAKTTRSDVGESTWITKNDINTWFTTLEKQGYLYYIDE